MIVTILSRVNIMYTSRAFTAANTDKLYMSAKHVMERYRETHWKEFTQDINLRNSNSRK